MTIRTNPWPTGVPCWADLSTPDVDGAAAFYGAVLGWEVVATGLGGYRLALVQGHPAAGLGAAGPTAWGLNIATDDLGATVAKALAAGGSVVSPVREAGAMGRLAVLADPAGVPFVAWQAGTHIGAGWVNAPGGMSWEDLRSPDPVASREFYAAVFGWRFDLLFSSPDGEYGTVANPDAPHPVGGIGPLWGSAPGWLVYFGVADVDAAARAAVEHGGEVVAEPHDSAYGRMAQVRDPAGATFAVFTPPAGAPQPER